MKGFGKRWRVGYNHRMMLQYFVRAFVDVSVVFLTPSVKRRDFLLPRLCIFLNWFFNNFWKETFSSLTLYFLWRYARQRQYLFTWPKKKTYWSFERNCTPSAFNKTYLISSHSKHESQKKIGCMKTGCWEYLIPITWKGLPCLSRLLCLRRLGID